MEEELEQFLKDREAVTKSALEAMKYEKIDMSVVIAMGEDGLKKYVPRLGDRMALIKFCKNSSGGATFKSKRRMSVVDRIKQSLMDSDNHSCNVNKKKKEDVHIGTGQKKYMKETRIIRIGWIMNGSAVRERNGGGVRSYSINQDATKQDILEKGIEFFFPNGISTKHGPLSQYTYDLLDYKENKFDNRFTVRQLYKMTGLTTLRFYLATYSNTEDEKEAEEVFERACSVDLPSTIRVDLGDDCAEYEIRYENNEIKELIYIGPCEDDKGNDVTGEREKKKLNSVGYVEAIVSDVYEVGEKDGKDLDDVGYVRASVGDVREVRGREELELNKVGASLSDVYEEGRKLDDVGYVRAGVGDAREVRGGEELELNNVGASLSDVYEEGRKLDDVGYVRASVGDVTEVSTESREARLDLLATVSSSKTIVVHRGHILRELIEEFVHIENIYAFIEIQIMAPNGTKEAAYDGGGVFKDALTEFWNEFYETMCDGAAYKIPAINYVYTEEKWKAVAKIILMGFRQVNYFPTKLPRPFIEFAVQRRSDSNLCEAYLHYLPAIDADILRRALVNFEDVDSEDLLEVLSNVECKQLVNQTTIKQVTEDLAHTAIIQKAMFVLDCWHSILRNKLTAKELNNIYETNKVTNKTVINLLKCFEEDLIAEKQKVFDFIKKFLREADNDILARFLRFCTGADIITSSHIQVEFTQLQGAARRPTSHTCNNILVVPVDYDCYRSFKSEFNSVLKSNMWAMEIV